MRIGIDARELCGHRTGVGRYLDGLIRAWASDGRATRHEFVLYSHEPLGETLDTRRFATRVLPGTGGTFWEQRTLRTAIARDHLDLLFAPGYTAPLYPHVPFVVAIHDASFAAHPEWFTAREGIRRRFLSRRAAAGARAVITISQFSRRQLTELLSVPADRIHVVPPGIDSPARPKPLGPSPERVADDAKRVLYVGSIFNRRHVPDLVRAFAHLARAHPGVSLDLVGDNRSYPRQDIEGVIRQEQLGERIRWHRYLPEPELSALYHSAGAFAFLSEYEGLGLTPLEALSAGVPPVLLDTPVARESCQDAAIYVASNDIPATAHALARVLFSETTRRSVLGAAPAVLAQYSWTRAAEETLAVFEGAV